MASQHDPKGAALNKLKRPSLASCDERIVTIRLTLSPPNPMLDGIPGLLADPGGYCYALFRDTGVKHIGGTCRGTDRAKAKERALDVSRRAGYTHYRIEHEEGIFPL